MCKVFSMVGINDQNRKQAIQILKAVKRPMCAIEKDGFGYAAITKDGNIFGEKWLSVDSAFMDNSSYTLGESERFMFENYDDFLFYEEKYQSIGEIDLDNAVTIIAHSRMATTGAKTIQNVHPFFYDNTAFIHNGMVYNHKQLKKKISENDSETLLHQYIDFEIKDNPDNIEFALSEVDAYFACMALSNNEKDGPILDIFKTEAFLHMFYLPDLKILCFTTKPETILAEIHKLKIRFTKPFEVLDDSFLRINPITAKPIYTFYYNYERYKPYTDMSKKEAQQWYKSKYGESWKQHYDADELDDQWWTEGQKTAKLVGGDK